jgi:hypothetical protein
MNTQIGNFIYYLYAIESKFHVDLTVSQRKTRMLVWSLCYARLEDLTLRGFAGMKTSPDFSGVAGYDDHSSCWIYERPHIMLRDLLTQKCLQENP